MITIEVFAPIGSNPTSIKHPNTAAIRFTIPSTFSSST
nr:MAG TPA: hypothetical protein [Bacteriophage sp.]